MHKYLTVFAVDWQNQFIYRLNFLLWRLRNVLRLLMTYFLWTGVFSTNAMVFGYSQSEMVGYIFMVLIVQSIIFSAPSADNIGGEISNGDLSNYLVKPVSYLKYWFTRDLSSKMLNIIFSIGEVTALWLLLRPEINFTISFPSLAGLVVMSVLATVLYFFVNVAVRTVSFWNPENTWGYAFIVLIFMEILAGGIFPLDVLPRVAQTLVQLTPFPYMVYYPIAIFIGKVSGGELIRIVIQAMLWTGIMYWITMKLWNKGLKVYAAEGK